MAAVFIVPNWESKAWHVWLRRMASAAWILPWQTYPATWLDVSEKKVKAHVLAQRFEFVAFAVDLREKANTVRGVQPLGRWKDTTTRPPPKTRLQKSIERKQTIPKHLTLKRLLRVLSVCGGMGTTAWCLLRVIKLLKLSVEVEVYWRLRSAPTPEPSQRYWEKE